MRKQFTKRKFMALFCSVILSLTFLSSTAAAASADVALAACNHNWQRKLVETRQTVVESNHECTICGAKISLFQDVKKYGYQCSKCREWKSGAYEEERGAIYSTHPCYN